MEFADAMNEWIALKAQLAAARRDLAVLNKREKELKKFVTTHMAENEIDTVKVKDKVKVNLKTKKAKGGITKDVIRKGLTTYFEGDAARVDGALQLHPRRPLGAVAVEQRVPPPAHDGVVAVEGRLVVRAVRAACHKRPVDLEQIAMLVDDVIDPRDTRRAIAWGLELSAHKQIERPARKRGVIPV